MGGTNSRVRARQREQNAECSDSEGENALGDTGAAAISTAGTVPAPPWPQGWGLCVPQSVTGRSLSVTDISERPHLGTHSPPSRGCPSGSAWDGHQWSHHSARGQQQPKASPGLPCRAQRSGAATLRWASTTRLGPVCAQSLLQQHRALGLAAGCTHGSGVREEPGTAHLLLGQVAAEPHAILLHEKITGERGDEQSHKFLFCHPGAHGGTSRGWETPGGKTGGESRGDTSNLTPSRVAEGCTPAPRGPGSWGRCQGQYPGKRRQGSSLGEQCDPPQQDDQQCPSP